MILVLIHFTKLKQIQTNQINYPILTKTYLLYTDLSIMLFAITTIKLTTANESIKQLQKRFIFYSCQKILYLQYVPYIIYNRSNLQTI